MSSDRLLRGSERSELLGRESRDTASIAVHQAAQQAPPGLCDEVLLPRDQLDSPFVLASRTVLREEAWPMLGVQITP